jgi:protein-S-isoprenylcysteine O-methyltransferase Ste14
MQRAVGCTAETTASALQVFAHRMMRTAALVLRKHHRRTAADRGACKMTNRPMLLTPAGHNSMMR